MNVLLTGLNPFGGLRVNPTQLIVESLVERASAIWNINLVAEVLPTEYDGGGNRVIQLIRHQRPVRIICLGVRSDLKAIQLERVALNLDDAHAPDNVGNTRTGMKIVHDGPLAYHSTLPIEEMRDAIRKLGIPANISNHAGNYVCNHVFYVACHEVERLGTGSQCGFIHVPQISEHQAADAQLGSLPLSMMVEAIECCLRLPKTCTAAVNDPYWLRKESSQE
jgi:pyroglutamyl-peptidase